MSQQEQTNNPNKGVEQQRTADSLGQLIIKRAHINGVDEIPGIKQDMFLQLINNDFWPNSIPIITFRNMLRLLAIPLSEAIPAMYVTGKMLEEKKPKGRLNSRTDLWECEEALTKYINRLKELMPESTPSPSLADIDSPAVEILKELCELKHYKDNVGKDAMYEREQPKAWKRANEYLNSLVKRKATNSCEPPIPPDISTWIKDEAEKIYPYDEAHNIHYPEQEDWKKGAEAMHNLLSPKLTAQEQRIKKLEEALNAINALDDRGDLNPQTQARFSIAIAKFALGLSKIVPGDAVSDTRDGDSKANPDQQKPDLAEQLRAMNPHKRGVFANGYNFACNKLNEIINDKK